MQVGRDAVRLRRLWLAGQANNITHSHVDISVSYRVELRLIIVIMEIQTNSI